MPLVIYGLRDVHTHTHILKEASVPLLTWRGTVSQHMPKMAHFLGVKKYIGPG